MKAFIEDKPEEARNMLLENPPIAQALLLAQTKLGMTKKSSSSTPAPIPAVVPSTTHMHPSHAPPMNMGGPPPRLILFYLVYSATEVY
jgi:hypothetical protein